MRLVLPNVMRVPYITPHYTNYTTLNYTTLNYTPLHYATLHYTTLHYTTLDYSYSYSHNYNT